MIFAVLSTALLVFGLIGIGITLVDKGKGTDGVLLMATGVLLAVNLLIVTHDTKVNYTSNSILMQHNVAIDIPYYKSYQALHPRKVK